MKILHVGDVHLGCSLEGLRRNRELESVFLFLCGVVRSRGVECVLFAGDVFDNGTPSHESQNLYFHFLTELLHSGCRTVILIAGNHDSPSLIDAPKELLSCMNIHAVGSVDRNDLRRELVLLGPEEAPEACVCAVPYLRDGDIRSAVAEGESTSRQEADFRDSFAGHYRQVRAAAEKLVNGKKVPLIAMGHFYASGSTFSSPDRRQTVGTLSPMDLNSFADGFSYFALGHLHKPQTVAGHEEWRYAGSLLPMDFREDPVSPSVVLADTRDLKHPEVIPIPESCFQKMVVICGDLPELQNRLAEFRKTGESVWVKPVYTGTQLRPNWPIDLALESRFSEVRILAPETRSSAAIPAGPDPLETSGGLSTLTPEQVFLAHLDRKHPEISQTERDELLNCFRLAQGKVQDPSGQKEKTPSSVNGIMRFRHLFLRNVNSLYGENRIDFDDPEFSSGIFLISGSTGSGKSSILDGICLALFGATPRAGEISGSADIAMSEGKHEMGAELVFSIGPDEFRSVFHHVRSGNTFRTPTLQLFRNGKAETGTTITVSRKAVCELIGMDLQQFMRCVLLSQGNFDAFLHSGLNERSAILKNITGTEVYSRISQQISLEYSEISHVYEALQHDIDSIQLLPEEECLRLQQEQKSASAELKVLTEKIAQCAGYAELFRNIQQGEAALQAAALAAEKATAAHQAAEGDRLRWKDAERAQNCQADHQAWSDRKKERDVLRKKQEEIRLRRTGLERTLSETKAASEKKRKNLKQAEEQSESGMKLIRQVRELDSQAGAVSVQKQSAEERLKQVVSLRRKTEETFRDAEKIWNAVQEKARTAETYLAAHPGDELLAQKQETWELRKHDLLKWKTRLDSEETSFRQTEESFRQEMLQLETLSRSIQDRKNTVQTLQKTLSDAEERRKILLNGRTREDLQNLWAAAEKISRFFRGSVRRESFLKVSEPCPLCGSKDHPYCEGVPVPEGGEYESAASALALRLKESDVCRETAEQTERKKAVLESEIATSEKDLSARTNRLQESRNACSARKETFIRESEDFRKQTLLLTEEVETVLQVKWPFQSELPSELRTRISDYASSIKTAEALAENRKSFEIARKVYQETFPQNDSAVRSAEEERKKISAELDRIRENRNLLFGEKDPDQESARLEEQLQKARKEQEMTEHSLIRTETELRTLHETLEACEMQEKKLLTELAEREKILSDTLQRFGFSSPEAFLEKYLPIPQMLSLGEKLQQLETGAKTARTAWEERRKILSELRARVPEGMTPESNQETHQTLLFQQTAVQQRWTEADRRLHSDQESVSRKGELQKRKDSLSTTFNHWNFLHNTYGTASGKNGTDRFGRIAQGYTFRELLRFANANRLEALRMHFTLVSDAENPLELCVIDHLRGNLVRSSRNLSGGESFEVSLALALGLAEMSSVSQKASLGNVLLDEGFGALDDHSLESALDLLMQLNHSDGKLVGIISHVAKLKEKIRTRIEVSSRCGIGFLSGAGVRCVSAPETDPLPKEKKRGRPRKQA